VKDRVGGGDRLGALCTRFTLITIITLEPCALNAEFQHFILSYFANLTQRGDMGVKGGSKTG
jgi:hypothetical protein